jgi:hypothetical protein
MVIRPPRGMASRAFRARLTITCSRWPRAPASGVELARQAAGALGDEEAGERAGLAPGALGAGPPPPAVGPWNLRRLGREPIRVPE